LTSYIFFIEFDRFINVLLITSLLIVIQGIWDDYTNLRASSKIAFQSLVIIIIIWTTNLKLNSFGDVFGFSYPVELGILAIPITIISAPNILAILEAALTSPDKA